MDKMDKLISIEEQRQQLIKETTEVIDSILKEKDTPEVEINPIEWGGDEDDPMTVDAMTSTEIIIYHQGSEVQRVQWRNLTLDFLVELGMALEAGVGE